MEPIQQTFCIGSFIVALVAPLLVQSLFSGPYTESLSYSELKAPVKKGTVRDLTLGSQTITGTLSPEGLEGVLSKKKIEELKRYGKGTDRFITARVDDPTRELPARETGDVRAAEAVALFCFQAKKWIGAFAAVLGELDPLVFAGGIGETAPKIRARICDGLGFLGLQLDEARDGATAAVISADASRVMARGIRPDEELMIARAMERVLATVENSGI